MNFVQKNLEDAIQSKGTHTPSGMGFGYHHGQYDQEDLGEHEYLEGYYQGQGYTRNESLPLSTLIEILQQKTGTNDIDVGK